MQELWLLRWILHDCVRRRKHFPVSAARDSGEKTKLYVVNWKDYASDDADYVKQFEEENNCEIVNTYMAD